MIRNVSRPKAHGGYGSFTSEACEKRRMNESSYMSILVVNTYTNSNDDLLELKTKDSGLAQLAVLLYCNLMVADSNPNTTGLAIANHPMR